MIIKNNKYKRNEKTKTKQKTKQNKTTKYLWTFQGLLTHSPREILPKNTLWS